MLEVAKFIPWLPALAAVLCGICCIRASLRPFAAIICIAGIAGAFVLSVIASGAVAAGGEPVHVFEWINVGGAKAFSANMSYFLDPLTVIMLFVVTGVGTLVAVYAAGYMKGDPGYARFFAGVSLFIFAMTTLVLADNLVLLYLGWEGVGLCSYLLIGFYYNKPSAVAAAKKAFIVNRIGDLGFALGIFWIWQTYGTVELSAIIETAKNGGPESATAASTTWIPFLLMLGAFGKSAQLPLYVWLPDAMEGPTPVSALIHAATMVTAGVYMIARLMPVFALSEYALPTVATVGAFTAIFAASIALCQNDLKRVFAYSTISQLGYMFLGVGVLAAVGGIYHLFTHAFFKALLFLTAGSVMHACAGQLDLKKLSGLRHKMPITCWLMFIGCIALAGVPYVGAGFYSKDMILAATLEGGMQGNSWFIVLAIVGIVTAAMTAYYTFRLWFRVFMGPEFYEMGDDHHADDHGDDHHHAPHEMPWLMNAPLLILAVGSTFILPWFAGSWVADNVESRLGGKESATHALVVPDESTTEPVYFVSDPVEPANTYFTAAGGEDAHGPSILGMSGHTFMILVSFIVSFGGIAVAAYFHLINREAADRFGAKNKALVKLLANKWHVDELYDAVIVRPLNLLGNVFFIFDRMIIDGLVASVGALPGMLGRVAQPAQRGALQGYGLGMAFAGAVIVIAMIILTVSN